MTEQSFICGTCGEEHAGLPTDYAFGLPDEVYALGYLDRYSRSRSNEDFCTLDQNRYFIRGVLPIPFTGTDEEFVWGLWAEVTREHHDLYLAGYYDDLSDNPAFDARLANDIPGYESLLETLIQVRFGSGKDRPAFRCASGRTDQLAIEQRDGIPRSRHHGILEGVGFFREPE